MSRPTVLAELRNRVATIERHAAINRAGAIQATEEDRALSFGLAAVDDRFSLGGLAFGVHQAAGAPGDRSAAALFAMLCTARRLKARPDHPVLVVQEAAAMREDGAFYGPGLLALGLDPGRLAWACVEDGAQVLRTVDQAARSGAVCAVVAELRRGAERLDLGLTQRLNVHAQQTGTFLLLVTPELDGTSAALSRWRVRTAPSRAPRRYLGPPALDLELVRNRHGRLGRWILEWSSEDEAFRLPVPLRAPLVSPPAHRPHSPRFALAGGGPPGGGGEIEVRLAAHGGR